jgi:hypothetical protein
MQSASPSPASELPASIPIVVPPMDGGAVLDLGVRLGRRQLLPLARVYGLGLWPLTLLEGGLTYLLGEARVPEA